MTNTVRIATLAIRPNSNLTSFVISIVRRKQTKRDAENFLKLFFTSKKVSVLSFFLPFPKSQTSKKK